MAFQPYPKTRNKDQRGVTYMRSSKKWLDDTGSD